MHSTGHSLPRKIVVTGAAGLVGQNLIPRLGALGFHDIVGIDKHPANTVILRQLHPGATVIEADLAHDDGWQESFIGADAIVISHAQIGGTDPQPFIDNNILATERVLAAAKSAGVAYIVQISSSVVNSAAIDHYTETKKAQEKLALESGLICVVLRPTLMFGWFDRKHLGWLARFMRKVPVFPIPGNGRFLRQPLYAGDFCSIIASCVAQRTTGIYNISGLKGIDYIDLIKAVRETLGLRVPLLHIPVPLFSRLLDLYALFSKDPPFTSRQLVSLITPDVFEVIDWPSLFRVKATPLDMALRETLCHPLYSDIELEF
jgi:nucleoside-diphosphate-sugar epimerase